MKNIAIFLDGTWNATDDYTNVYNLYLLSQGLDIDFFRPKDQLHKSVDQLRYYDRGVGTTLSSPSLLGGAIGLGLKRNVAQAWQLVSRHYEVGDQIYLFGFSRGAYTARSLAGVLNFFGRLKLPNEYSPVGMRLDAHLKAQQSMAVAFSGIELVRNRNLFSSDKFARALAAFRQKHCIENASSDCIPQFINDDKVDPKYTLPIKFVGIWDTVGALGIPWLFQPGEGNIQSRDSNQNSRLLRLMQRNWMPDSIFPNNIQHAFHALAIDEHRPHFQATLWKSATATTTTQDQLLSNRLLAERVEQRWFAGAHSNIGGGYPDNRLNALPFEWIYNNARSHGLKLGQFLHPQLYSSKPMSALEPVMDSYAAFRYIYGLSSTFKRFYRKLSNSDCTQTLSPAAHFRAEVDRHYRPSNLMAIGAAAQADMIKRAARSDEQCKQRISELDAAESGDLTSE